MQIPEQEYFDNALVMVAMCKAGVELAFEEMVNVGLKPESAYYESLHETPLIANTIARMKLHEMNSVISDTAEYGCYIYSQARLALHPTTAWSGSTYYHLPQCHLAHPHRCGSASHQRRAPDHAPSDALAGVRAAAQGLHGQGGHRRHRQEVLR